MLTGRPAETGAGVAFNASRTPQGGRGDDLTQIQAVNKSWKLTTASRDGNH